MQLLGFKQLKPVEKVDNSANSFMRFVNEQQQQSSQVASGSSQNQSQLFSLLSKQNNNESLQSNLKQKHAKLFAQDADSQSYQHQPTIVSTYGLLSPRDQTSPIMEETSDNLSNVGQGSPLKKPIPILNPNAVSNFAATLKSMTPMPKLSHTFSQPLPIHGNVQNQLDFENNSKQAQIHAEFQGRERVQKLKQDLTETPNSKYKYKQISRDMKEHEKSGF